MTVDNLFNPRASQSGPMFGSGHVPSPSIHIPPRTRQASLGSAGSYDSSSSTSSSPPSPLSLDDVLLLQHLQVISAGSRSHDLDRSIGESCKTNINPTRYKTELCRSFEESGYCKYSEKCQFAHGAHELRKLMRHPKYKTELCRTYHTVGFCPYGLRCHFIHSEDVTKLAQISSRRDPMPYQQIAQQAAQQLMAQRVVAQQQMLSQLKSVSDMMPLLPQRWAAQNSANPKNADFQRLPPVLPPAPTTDSPPTSMTDFSPSLSPVLSILSVEDLFGTIPSGMPTPPPGFTAPPPPLYPKTSTPSPLETLPAALEDSLRSVSDTESRCVTPPSRQDLLPDWAKSPPRLPFFNGLVN